MCKSDQISSEAYYLPHHGVLKLDSETTKLRVAFNASSKSSSNKSLNDLMYSGPNLQKDLQAIILSWRTHKYVITADIEKMFRNFLIREEDQHLQCIVWRESQDQQISEYRLTTVTYGTKAAPYLAMRTLKQLADDEAKNFPLAAKAIKESFYTDDLLSGSDSLEDLKELQISIIKIFQSAKISLRKWSSNNPELLCNLKPEERSNAFQFKSMESRKTLGLKWDPNTDCFSYQTPHFINTDRITKRQLLSEISKLFDPLGWLSPLSIRAKLLFQTTWNNKMEWDDQVSIEIQQQWVQLRNDLKNIEEFKIPRYLGKSNHVSHIHAFCDAAKNSYACCLYLVATNDKGERTSTLIVAKTKLAPSKKNISLPRLELLGAVLLSQLVEKTLKSFPDLDVKVHAYSDSMITLGWICGDINRWNQFVANRIRQMTAKVPSSAWQHVRSEENPADCATRGLTKKQLLGHNLWWKGPEWLLSYEESNSISDTYEEPNIETKTSSVYVTLQDKSQSIAMELLHNYNSLTTITRVLAWVLRYIHCLRGGQLVSSAHSNVLSTNELNNARNVIIRLVQEQDFREDLEHIRKDGHVSSKSQILSLNPYIDEQGILKVGGRLRNANISDASKHPIILSAHSRLMNLIIEQAHITTLHGGPKLTLSFIRNRYWVISGIRTVKRQLRQCVRCRRFSGEKNQHIMGDLPKPRVTPSPPFTHTGVDFSGFVELKINKGRGIKTCKGYISIFVCLSTKATHLELVSDLSTQAFLAAFRRFCSRRGVPSQMYSDNGTNFVGADRLLKKEYQEIIQNINADFFNNISEFNIEWNFNAPAWPNAGGLWEAAVKSTKYHLRRVLGHQKLTYEEFSTLLCQVEACLNSRPLCQLTESPEDEYLTPGHFLVGGSLLSRPQTDPDSVTLTKRWQLVQSLNKHFWKKWSSEYLQQLQARTKWRRHSKNFSVDDVVIIKDENLPPGKWALGRIQDVHPGQDGFIRVVTLKTKDNIIKRPINKLILLPVVEHDQEKQQETPVNEASQATSVPSQDQGQDRPQRPRRRNVNYKNFFITMLLLFMSIISPSSQVTLDQTSVNVSVFNSTQNLFFDKITDLQFVKDEWKLVIYYNLTTYWNGVTNIEQYIDYIKGLAKQQPQHYKNTIVQLEHEMTEIKHYNRLLLGQNKQRQKRGLINGVGYLASELFGVLDERFAEKYKQDVENIVANENHLQLLLKNQTSVLESEYNILRRNEQAMSHQFKFIKEKLYNLSLAENKIRLDEENGLYIMFTAITADRIISNMRRMQQTIINTITDISQGHIDPHLLSPEELENQMNIISGQLNGDILPFDRHDIKDMYQVLRAAARIYDNYLIIEVRIPLLTSDIFELNQVVSFPVIKQNESYYVKSVFPYVAYNMKKDNIAFLSDIDLQSCLHSLSDKLLCNLNIPTYDLQLKQSLCNIKILNTYDESTCKTSISTCHNRWFKLHRQNTWLFACCSECHVSIQCPSGLTIKQLSGTGLITLGAECKLRGTGYSLYTHNDFISKINIDGYFETPKISMLNTIINTSALSMEDFKPHSEEQWERLNKQINDIKEQSNWQLSIHDVHHYSILYVIISIIIVASILIAVWNYRRRNQSRGFSPGRPAAPVAAPEAPQPTPRNSMEVLSASDRFVSEHIELKPCKSVSSVNVGTSPVLIKSRLYDS